MCGGWAPTRLCPPSLLLARLLALVGQMLDRHHTLLIRRIEDGDALGRTARNADSLYRAADALALVSHQHDLVAVLNRERRHELAVATIARHRDAPHWRGADTPRAHPR